MKFDHTLYHGADAIHVLAMISARNDTWLMGKVSAFEKPLSDNSFSMEMKIEHALLGTTATIT